MTTKTEQEIEEPTVSPVDKLIKSIDTYFVNRLKMEPHKYDIAGEYFKSFTNKQDGRSISINIKCNVINLGSLIGYCPLDSEIDDLQIRYENLKSKIVDDNALQNLRRKKRAQAEEKNIKRKEQIIILRKSLKFYKKTFKRMSKKMKIMEFTIQEQGFGKSPIWFLAFDKSTVVVIQLQVIYYKGK